MSELLEEPYDQHLLDFSLAIEYKDLMKHAPGGVYLMPEFDDFRKMHGVIFLRRGLFRDGVFRFSFVLPNSYNSLDSHPIVHFTPPIFHPLIDPTTGELDLKLEFPSWKPNEHYLSGALLFIKKIFYMNSFDKYLVVPNESARRQLLEDKTRYLETVSFTVENSKGRLYDEPQDKNCTLIFTESKPAHDLLREEIIGGADEGLDGQGEGEGEGGDAERERERGGGSPGLPRIQNPSSSKWIEGGMGQDRSRGVVGGGAMEGLVGGESEGGGGIGTPTKLPIGR